MSWERKIHHHLHQWLEAGLITPDQAEAIRQHEQEHSSSNFLFWLMWLAGSCIVLGIIALIATNWDFIPSVLKLILYFAGFAAAGYALLKTFADKPIVQEVIRLALMGYTMAGIGLVAQIYHLHSAPYRGLAFWCVLTFGLALFGKTSLGSLSWITTALAALGLFLETKYLPTETKSILVILVFGFLGVLGSLPRGFSLFRHFQSGSFLAAGFATLTFSLIEPYNSHSMSWTSNKALVILTAMLAAWAFTILANKDLDRVTKKTFVLYLAFFLAQALTLAVYRRTAITPDAKPLVIIESLLGLLALALSAFSFGKRQVFEMLIVLVFLRLVVLYSEYMFSNMVSGFGFITFGLLLLAAIYVWKKFRTRLFQKLAEEIDAKK